MRNIRCTEIDNYNEEMIHKLMTVANQVCPFVEITIRNGHFKETKKMATMKRKRKNLFANAKNLIAHISFKDARNWTIKLSKCHENC